MKYTIVINQKKAVEWELNLQQSALMAFCYELSSWADPVIFGSETFYFCSKTKVITELPVLTDKIDTVYRTLKTLEEKGLILVKKQGVKDLIKLTAKGKTWNSEKNPNSEKFPNEPGKKSENEPEKNPTYNTTIVDNTTNDNEAGQAPAPTPEEIIDKKKRAFFNELISWVRLHPEKYPKELYFNFAKWWTEANLKTKKIRRDEEKYFEMGGRIATFFKRASDTELSSMWANEKASPTLDKQLSTLLKN